MAHTLSYLLHTLVVLSVSLFLTIDAADPTFLVPTASTSPSSVSEDEVASTSILTLEGQDTDGDTLTFSIVTQNPTSPPFELESGSGLLKVPSGLDAELSTNYTFVFGVRDASTTTNSVPYVVNIVYVNDNRPTVNPATYVNTVSDSAPIGTSVGRVTATDADVSGNTITFSTVAGNNSAVFALDQTSGEITVSAALNASTMLSFSITIQASDGTWNAATPATVTITIIAPCCGDNEDGAIKLELLIPLIIVGLIIIIAVPLILHRLGVINLREKVFSKVITLHKHNIAEKDNELGTQSGNEIDKDFPGNGHIKSSLPPIRHDLKSASRSSKTNREFSKDEIKLDINI